ncbi:Actin-binding protein [Wickerhamomyces ciferrii]|uniref:Actin-binding protein n=1 Tax=Wickerhamomyces ciferrii (strain ATCC 14091 / BCRC 22168 / CBS 111 / JCM 3599 / NBRC 0793 / NRRL Y-1031 F-60-10) TaxID=1206466 RepID=K0KMN2_WICCF|nr:Actin-binding protein [Wickerhamomyces ciferrii]CCH42373.1 Actin-binding protein [Wickerhamomyces ciferrii]
MEQINLSTHGKEIQKAYEQVVRGDPSITWVIYGPDSQKAYKVNEQGTEFDEFLESFDESQIQFGLARVNPPGSDVQKNLLIGWCPDSAPIKSRSSFAQNFAEVSRLLKGYHIQVTARDTDDLDRNDLLSRVSAAAGARYSIQSARSNAPTSSSSSSFAPKPFKPKTVETPKPKPAPTPAPAPKAAEPQVIKPSPSSIAKAKAASTSNDDDWNEPEIKERDFSKDPLKPNTSTYKPIGRVNLQDVIKEEKSRPDPRLEIEQLKEKEKLKKEKELDDYLKTKSASFGAKPPAPASGLNKDSDKVVGGISKSFGTENGKTPAQIWAEKKQKSSNSTPEASAPSTKPEETEETEDQEEEEANVSDLKSKFDKLNTDGHPSPGLQSAQPEITKVDKPYDFQKNAPPAFKSGIPSPGIKSAYPGEERPAFPGRDGDVPEQDEEEEEEEKEEPKEEPEEEEKPPVLPSRGAAAAPPPPPSRSANATPTPSLPPRAPVAAPEPEPEPEVEEQEPEPEVEEETEETGATAIAEYDYEASEDNEITFVEGQKIINIQFVDEDWWLGETESGDKGLFPANYDEKYQKAMYKPKKQQQKQQQQQQQPKQQQKPKEESKPVESVTPVEKKDKKESKKEDKVTKPSFDLGKYKGKSLSKVIKKLSKDEQKDLLKKIQITKDGKLELKL